MTEVSPLAELLGHAIYHFEIVKPLMPTYAHLLVSALFPIYIGAHASLSRPSSAAKPRARHGRDGDKTDDEDDDEESETEGGDSRRKMEGLEPSDAIMFPLTAGLTLGGVYLVIKWLEDPAILNKILSFYFSQMGLFFAISFLKDGMSILRSFIFPRRYRQRGKLWKARQSEGIFVATNHGDATQKATDVCESPLPGIFSRISLPSSVTRGLWTCRGLVYRRVQFRARMRGLIDLKCMIGILDVISGLGALAAVSYFAFVSKPWWLTNFLGFSFSYGALRFMSPSTFTTGSMILGSLFLYDIYFVFFTPLMVTVATKLDVPIKLLFPRPAGPDEAPDATSLAMLGLGDIVIPGMMIGLALRFDLFLFYKMKSEGKARAEGKEAAAVRAEYQSATGAWGERFWAGSVVPRGPEYEPPYHDARSFPRTYFKASLVGYIMGMVTTLVAMQYSNHPQPALLYLVPGVLISLWGTAFVRGEIREMWSFSDAQDEEEEVKHQADLNESGKKETGTEHRKDTRSLFSRIWSGDVKALQRSAEEKQRPNAENGGTAGVKMSGDDAHPDPTDAPNKTGDEEDVLFSISMSMPHKKSPEQREVPTITSSNNSAQSTSLERDSEPPTKRPRRSPRHLES